MAGERRRTAYMPLTEVARAPRNPRLHRADLIAASMARFGVVEIPTIDDRTGRLVAGHGRLDDWQRRKAAGQAPPDGIDVTPDGEWLVPVSRGWASKNDAEAEAYLLVSNRTTELASYDEAGLVGILVDVRNADTDLLALTGWDDDDVDDMIRAITGDDSDDPLPGNVEVVDPWPVLSMRVPPHVAQAWETHLAEHDGVEFKALAELLGVDPMFAPAQAA